MEAVEFPSEIDESREDITEVTMATNEAVEFPCDLCDFKTTQKKRLNKYMNKHSIREQVDGINDKESDMEPISDTLESNEVNMAKKDSTTLTPVSPPIMMS